MGYIHPPPLTTEELELFLKKNKLARFCSINEDGTIHAVPVWYIFDEGQIIIGTPESSRKVRNVKRNNKITILIDQEGPPAQGVIIYGQAEMVYDDILTTGAAIFENHMAKLEAKTVIKDLMKITKWIQIIITPEHMISFNYGKDSTNQTGFQG